MADVALDIEVVAPAWEELDEPTREYLLGRAKTDEDRAEVPNRLALQLGLARVVAIGMWSVEEDRGIAWVEGERAAVGEVAGQPLVTGSEAHILSDFWTRLGSMKRPRIVTFNGRGFDGPVLMIRSAQLGIVPSRNLVPYRYDIAEHCDLMDVLGFQGTVRQSYSLDWWCRRFGTKSPKGEMTGADVARVHGAGDAGALGRYVLDDVRATAALYQRLRPILHFFKGGPPVPAPAEVAA